MAVNSESANYQIASALTGKRQITRTRSAWNLTTAERRLFLVLVDIILINLALLIAASVWNGFVPSISRVWAHAKWFITLSAVWFGFGTVFDIYNLARSASVTTSLANVGLTGLLVGPVYLFIPWLTPPMNNRSYAYGFLVLGALLVLGWRVIYARALNQPSFRQWALILGTGETAQTLARSLVDSSHADRANPFRGTGYQVLGMLCDPSDAACTDGHEFPVLGDGSQLASLAQQHSIDEIIIALDSHHVNPQMYEALLDCRESGIRVSSFADVYERLTARLPVGYDERDLDLLLGPADAGNARLYAAAKRLFDVLVAAVGLVALAMVLPFVALGNLIWSRGPLLYRQQRVGQGGRPFALIKFRTMIPDAEQATGIVWSSEKDPRITFVGRLLRKTRIDELPQFINVLRGEMSIIGPRPERPHFVGQLDRQLPLYRARHSVKPGITGWAQVQYRYGNSIEDSRIKLEFDLYYVKHASIYLDLLIVLQTFRVVLQLKGT